MAISNRDLDDMMSEPMPVASAKAGRATRVAAPKLSKEERAAKKVTDARAVSSRIGSETRQRRSWEQSEVGRARTRNIVDLNADHMEIQNNQRDAMFKGGASSRLSNLDYRAMKPHEVYRGLGVTNSEGHGFGEQQIPGLENPHAAPEPPRWEDLSPKHREKTEQNLRLQGTSLRGMQHDFGAELDQSIWRAHVAGASRASTGEPVPFTAHFYGHTPHDAPAPLDEPQDMMRESREHLASKGIHADPNVHSAAMAMVSPNVKFTAGERGARTSPNIEAAESVFEQHAAGSQWQDVSSGVNRTGTRNQSRPANSRRAAKMMEHVEAGGTVGSARNAPSMSKPEGSSMWGPKTGPFQNSFDPQHPDYLVSDVHTGGGGFFPHKSTDKPFKTNPDGSLVRMTQFRDHNISDDELRRQVGGSAFQRDKSDREKAMEQSGTAVPGSEGKKVTFHAAGDYAARQALAERGLSSSVRRPQASQWGEEQLQRGEQNPKLDVAGPHEAYPQQHHIINPNQLKFTE